MGNNKPKPNKSGGQAPQPPSLAQPSKKKPKKKDSGSAKYLYASVAVVVAAAAVALPYLYASQAPLEAPPPIDDPSFQDRKPKKEKKAKKAPSPPTPTPARPGPQSGPIDPSCVDENESCEQWARSGECDRNTQFMHSGCRASCHICNGGKRPPKRLGACEDSNDNCATWAAIGECQSNPGFMLQNCPVTCKMCQSETCKDDLPDCTERCKGGAASNFSENLQCYHEPELVEKCAWTCGACKEHRFDRPQCERRKGLKAGVGKPGEDSVAGSVNEIFERIVASRPDVNVLSSPEADGPWVVTIDNFLSDDECEDIIAAGSTDGTQWGRSMAGDGVQAARTSSTAWCQGKCLKHPTTQKVEQRVSSLLGGIPMENAEPMQVLRYELGQYYKVHHDQNSPRSSAWGPRMFTVFMYVGDGYEGGLTHFPKLNITIPAKKGAACVWTSVLDSDPYQRDDRTDHESLPVEGGVKYGVNYWIHMYPFRTVPQGVCGNQAYIQNWH
tara:strand:+ start:702 stop:2198 length:1497 start_codon:yes stop_codon:yes gene_type:complete